MVLEIMPLPLIQLHVWNDEEDWQKKILNLAAAAGWQDAEMERLPDGKPVLRGAENFHFNVSTTRRRAIAAVGEIPVGVDWEYLGRRASCKAIADRYFFPQERAWMESAPDPGALSHRFFMLWTAKEAGVKLDGCGLYSGGLCNCGIDVSEDESGGLDGEIPVRGRLHGRDFRLHRCMVDGEYLVTVACHVDFQLALPADFSIVEPAN